MTNRQKERNAMGNIQRCMNSHYESLYDCYSRPSERKVYAWQYCQELCDRYDGWNLRILSYNTCKFYAGFFFADPETGVISFMYITPDYDVSVEC